MTINEAIYELRGIIRRENLYDDDRLDDRLLIHWLHNQRALWLHNDMNKPNRTIDEQIIQTLGCVALCLLGIKYAKSKINEALDKAKLFLDNQLVLIDELKSPKDPGPIVG